MQGHFARAPFFFAAFFVGFRSAVGGRPSFGLFSGFLNISGAVAGIRQILPDLERCL
jgi:hypothetical protein